MANGINFSDMARTYRFVSENVFVLFALVYDVFFPNPSWSYIISLKYYTNLYINEIN